MSARRLPLLPLALLCITPIFCQAGSADGRWGSALRQPEDYYAGDEARELARKLLAHQTSSGGWPKNTDFTTAAPAENPDATIDNGATTAPLRFLARVISSSGEKAPPELRAAFDRGVDYLLAAQYPNGGWPQFFPLRKGYYTHITYNDDAMVNTLELLRDLASGRAPFAFTDKAHRERAATAVEKGIDCILRTQVRQDGVLTVWCAQHDEKTLAPAWARNFEPPSLSGGESVGIVRFLMSIEKPSPEIVTAIEAAVAWFDRNKITGLRCERYKAEDGKPDCHVVAGSPTYTIWARFYELESGRPLFVDRDKVFRYDHSELSRERRAGYSYYVTSPRTLLQKDYPAWRARVAAHS